MKTFAAIAGGVSFAYLCFSLAVAIAGGGHGWNSPAFTSLTGFVLIPMSFWCGLHWRHPIAQKTCVIVALLLLATDVELAILSFAEGVKYIQRVAWIALWLLAQVPVIWAVAKKADQSGETAG